MRETLTAECVEIKKLWLCLNWPDSLFSPVNSIAARFVQFQWYSAQQCLLHTSKQHTKAVH